MRVLMPFAVGSAITGCLGGPGGVGETDEAHQSEFGDGCLEVIGGVAEFAAQLHLPEEGGSPVGDPGRGRQRMRDEERTRGSGQLARCGAGTPRVTRHRPWS